LSSAILYVAIVAIWAGVLIPRWLRRDSSASSSLPEPQADEETSVTADAEEEPAPPGRRRLRREFREELRAELSEELEEAADEEDLPELTGLVDRQVLSARRRLLIMLLLLTVGSGVLAATKLAAWWVIVPPSVMLLGYLLLLREAARADAERRDLILSRAAHAARAEAHRQAQPPVTQSEAEVITLTVAPEPEPEEELYDQYADIKRRAVGD
jgi:hypothetical protein